MLENKEKRKDILTELTYIKPKEHMAYTTKI